MYVRGALVLHHLRLKVGDETFFRILRTWVETYHDANASTEDFVAHCEQTSGQELDPLFQAWLYDPLIPEVPELEESID